MLTVKWPRCSSKKKQKQKEATCYGDLQRLFTVTWPRCSADTVCVCTVFSNFIKLKWQTEICLVLILLILLAQRFLGLLPFKKQRSVGGEKEICVVYHSSSTKHLGLLCLRKQRSVGGQKEICLVYHSSSTKLSRSSVFKKTEVCWGGVKSVKEVLWGPSGLVRRHRTAQTVTNNR